MTKDNKFYITTPIYYVNDKPHLGGAYTTVAADVLARFHRMKSEKVFFLTGTDEHGEKLAHSAQQNNKTPKEWCDENAAKYQMAWDTLQIAYDNFIRTTDPAHEKIVTKALEELYNKKLIYKGVYQGLYCRDCERYFTAKELVDGKCPYHQREPVVLSEDCYFFKLSAFQKPLLQLIDKKEWVIEPEERRNEVLGFLKSEELEDLAISRQKVEWGIPLPWDKNQTTYVWIDALLNYLSGIGWTGEAGKWPEIWPPEVQLIGKDILRFHAIIWPSLLLALDLPLPKKLYAHGFFTINGQKMSKSLGNVIDPEEFTKTFGADATRWLIVSGFPFGQDGDISQSKFYDKYEAELANEIGNLVSRVLTLATKQNTGFKQPAAVNAEFKGLVDSTYECYERALNQLSFESAAEAILNLAHFCDGYIEKNKPWKLIKDNIDFFQEVIYNLVETLRHLAWLIQPFMPETSHKIFDCLGIWSKEQKKSFDSAKKWADVEFEEIKKGETLFPRLK